MRITTLNELINNQEFIPGQWKIGPDEIYYETKALKEDIRFKGKLLAIEPGALLFAITEKRNNQRTVTNILKLTGVWSANSKNQFVFKVQKESGSSDILTLAGNWKLNDSCEIVYTYKETQLKTKKKILNEIVIKGYWNISEKNRLTYWIGGDSQSALHFRAAFQTKSILAKKGEIRYQIGFEVNGKRVFKELILFGKWIVSRDLSLFFEVTHSKNKSQIIRFGGDFSAGKNQTIRVDLQSEEGKPLGLELIFTKDFFEKDTEFFLRLLHNAEESKFESGVRLAW